MTDETLEEAVKLSQQMEDAKDTIGKIEKMLEKFYEENCCIRVSMKTETKTYDDTITISKEDIPELRDALTQARDRIQYEREMNLVKLRAL